MLGYFDTDLPETMMAMAISRPGGPEVLSPVDLPLPVPAAGEVVIAVAAAGVNAPDLAQRRGSYDPPPGASPLPGLEVAGLVVGAGKGVSGFAQGDGVVALTNGGGYAEYVSVPAGQVLPLPPAFGFAAAAALPETFFTVMQTLVMRAGLAPGMRVLVEGAAGGVGGAAVQIAAALGAEVIGLVSSLEKAAYVRELGAAHVVLREEDLPGRVRELTGGNGADRIVSMSGGATLEACIEAAARGGHVVLVAGLSGAPSSIVAGRLVQRQLTLSGSTLRPQPPEVKAAIAAELRRRIWPLLASGRIRPPRIASFPLAAAAAAHARLEQRSTYGKIVLVTELLGAPEPREFD